VGVNSLCSSIDTSGTTDNPRGIGVTHANIVVLLDYETNYDINGVTRPLSHAGLIKLYIENNWPMPTTIALG